MRYIIEVSGGVARAEAFRMNGPVNIRIPADEPLAVVGDNGSGKSLLVGILTGAHPLVGTEVKYDFSPSPRKKVSENVKTVEFRDVYGSDAGSCYYQRRWNQWDIGGSETVAEALRAVPGGGTAERLCEALGLDALLDKRIITLSGGELRKVQLAEALLREPRLVIIDNPFIGLDAKSRSQVAEFLARVAGGGRTMVMVVVSRTRDIPGFIRKVLYVENKKAFPVMDKDAFLELYGGKEACRPVSAAVSAGGAGLRPCDAGREGEEIIRCENVSVRYGGRVILDGFSWRVRRGERWALSGENGAGKSALLSLVCADNPQAYACDISLFGRRRGSGESIWDIKKRIGYVSPEMYRAYRKNIPAADIVAGGLHDTAGLYRRISGGERAQALSWMRAFGVENLESRPYMQLSGGEQRMLLLARAFVKDPELLVLDEPFHGLDERRRALARSVTDAFCRRRGKTLIMVSHYEEEYPDSIDHKLVLTKTNG